MRKKLVVFVMIAFIFSMFPVLPAVAGDGILELKITVPQNTVLRANSLQAKATLYYSDGTQKDVTRYVNWQSQDTDIATVNDNGKITGISEGTVLIDAIYIPTHIEGIYSDQIQITVESVKEIPYSVKFSPADGQLNSYQPIEMQFPCEVEIIDEYENIMETSAAYYLYQEADKTKVYILLKLQKKYQKFFPEITQLPWFGKERRINYATDDFEENIKPVGAKWKYQGLTTTYNFQSKEELPLELLGVHPKNNTNFTLSATGNTGNEINSILAPSGIDGHLGIYYLFNQPVIKNMPTAQLEIENTHPIGTYTGLLDLDIPYAFPSFLVSPKTYLNQGFYGYSMYNVNTKITLPNGSVKGLNGDLNTEAIISYTVNPLDGGGDSQYALYQNGVSLNNDKLDEAGLIKEGEYKIKYQTSVSNLADTPTNYFIYNDRIILGTSDGITAISRVDGSVLWNKPNPELDYTKIHKDSKGNIFVLSSVKTNPSGALNSHSLYLDSYNISGDLRFKTKLPVTVNKLFANSTYISIAENDDILVSVPSLTASGLGTSFFTLYRFNNLGEVKSVVSIGTGSIGSYLFFSPFVVWADSNNTLFRDCSNNLVLIENANGIYISKNILQTTAIPYTTISRYFTIGTVFKDGSKVYIPEALYQHDGKEGHARFLEYDLTTGNIIGHEPFSDGFVKPSGYSGSSNKNNFKILFIKNGEVYYNNGYSYNLATKSLTKIWDNDIALKLTDDVYLKTDGLKYFLGGSSWIGNYDLGLNNGLIAKFNITNNQNVIISNYNKIIELEPYTLTPKIYSISPKTHNIYIGDTAQETADLDGTDVTLGTTWTSSDNSIATIISSGEIKGIAEGTITITGAYSDGINNYTDTATVNVSKKPAPPITPPVTPPSDPEPNPEPDPEVEPDPDPEPNPEPDPEPEPEVEPDSVSTPKPTPKPNIIVEKEPEPIKNGVVKGYVKLKDGTPLTNARLELHSKVKITRTDNKGYFEFRDVELGTHKLYLADFKITDEKILIKALQVATADETRYIPITETVKDIETAQVTLTEASPEKEVEMIVDFELPQPEPEEKTPIPIWPWLLLLILLLILRRRRKLKQDEKQE